MKYERYMQSGLDEMFRGVVNADPAAFNALYDAVKRPLFAYCLSILRDEEEARDAFQATMMKIYESRLTFTGGNVHAWMFTIARNTARSVVRRQKFVGAMPVGFEPMADEPTGLSSDESEIVQKAILSLTDEFRQVILLKYFGDMSVSEIAESEDINEELVKTRLFRARKKLGEILGTSIERES